MIKNGISVHLGTEIIVKSYKTSLPKKRYDVMVPTVAEISRGKTDESVKSSMKISRAKTTPAMGALKRDAIAAEPAHVIIRTVCFLERWKNLDRNEPIPAPEVADGPSNPTEPPKPTVMALVIIVIHVFDTGIMLFCDEWHTKHPKFRGELLFETHIGLARIPAKVQSKDKTAVSNFDILQRKKT
jgi:hypothetical protein